MDNPPLKKFDLINPGRLNILMALALEKSEHRFSSQVKLINMAISIGISREKVRVATRDAPTGHSYLS